MSDETAVIVSLIALAASTIGCICSAIFTGVALCQLLVLLDTATQQKVVDKSN